MSSVATLTAVHLESAAYVYIRQSSEFQVQNHVERQRLQYALADYAEELGFRDVEVINDDLGISGAGVHRPGLDALLEAVCKGRVGLVLSIEASRLSRNGREWYTLPDFCAIVGCLVGDRDRLYDPALIDDRMYLGLKGQFNKWSALHFDIMLCSTLLDELGFVPLSKTEAELLFEVVLQRYERTAMLTSNLPFDEWTETFGPDRLTSALLDRLTHYLYILEMNGESFGLNQSRARKKRAPR